MKHMVIVVISLFLFLACADNKKMNGKTYETYGLINEGKIKDDCVNYEASMGNLIWGIILVETLIAPVYFFGFSFWEPISFKDGCVD